MKKEVLITILTALFGLFLTITGKVYSLEGRVDSTDSYQKIMHQDLSGQIKEIRGLLMESK
jgi:hypothetical protein